MAVSPFVDICVDLRENDSIKKRRKQDTAKAKQYANIILQGLSEENIVYFANFIQSKIYKKHSNI